jgi:hypothetical protein
MPFLGTLPVSVRSILRQEVSRWKTKELYLPCSGRFTVARSLVEEGLAIHGNDISLYSCALGAFYAKQAFPAEIVHDGFLDWMEPFMQTPEDRVASVIVWSEFALPYAKRTANPHYERLTRGFIAQYPRMHAETKVKMEAAKLRLASFWAGDCVEYVTRIPEGAGIITAPPVYAGGYEAMWKFLELRFKWEQPEYPMFDEKALEVLLDLLEARDRWAIITQSPMERLEPYHLGEVRETERGTKFYLYSSGKKPTRLVRPASNLESPMIERLGQHDEIEGPITLLPMDGKEFNAVRAKELNENIAPGAASASVAVLAKGKLIGCLALGPVSTGSFRATWGGLDSPQAYLLSDFPVRPTKYPRLSKLIVMAALSKEFQMLAERLSNHPFKSICTTAFTKAPVSMKYRGLLELMSRKPAEGEDKAKGFLWRVNYGSPMGRWTLDDAFGLWKKKNETLEQETTP